MAYVPRILFFTCNYFRYNKTGIFATYYETRKLFSVVSNLESRLYDSVLLQSNFVMTSKRLCTNVLVGEKKIKSLDLQKSKMLNKFKHLHLEDLVKHANCFHESALLALFHKMCVVYHSNKSHKAFLLNLPYLLKTEEFQSFCSLLEENLTKLSPDGLSFLLNLELFKVPVDCSLMRKILTLTLDNFNCFSLCDILELYILLKKDYFKNSKECNNILNACEVYFAEAFEDEISHCVLYEDLVYFLPEENLPFDVRKIIAERILEFLSNNNSFRLLILQKFFHSMFRAPFFPLFKDKTMKVFKNIISTTSSNAVQRKLCDVYQVAVCHNNDYYDEEVCEILLKSALNSGNTFVKPIITMEKLCLMGHFNKELFQHTMDLMLSLNFCNWKPFVALSMASILARINFHEMEYSNLEKVREVLLSYNAKEAFTGDFMSLLKWTEYLTYLGCDTKDLLNNIFTILHDKKELKHFTNSNCCSIIQFYHFIEEYFSDGYTKLSDNILDFILFKASLIDSFYSRLHLKEYFGSEDCLIKKCKTSNKYFIPLAVILGPDNKPIKLASTTPTSKNLKENTSKMFSVIPNIEDIPRPPGSKVCVFLRKENCLRFWEITFMEYPDVQPIKFKNAPMTSGVSRIFLKSFQKFPHDMVLLNVQFIMSQPEDKIKYLQSQIDELIKKPDLRTLTN